MHVLIRDGDLVIEVQDHDGRPRMCVWTVDEAKHPEEPHRSKTFSWGDYYVLDELHYAVDKIVQGVRAQ